MRLSFQKINMYSRCGLQYYYRYVKGIKIPPTPAVVQGRACHEAAEVFYREKQTKGENPPLELMLDVYSESLDKDFQTELLLDEEEQAKGKKKIQAELKDKGIGMIRTYHGNRAVHVIPFMIEQQFELSLKDVAPKVLHDYNGSLDDVVLEGYVDLADVNGTLLDLKTRKRPPNSDEADKSQQLTIYTLGYKTVLGVMPRKIALDCLVPATTRSPAKLITLETLRTDEDIERLIRRIVRVVDGIKKGVFIPPDQGSWACKYCGYRQFGICKDYIV